MTPEELTAELIRQLERTRVDLRAAHPRMHQVVPPIERESADGTVDVQFTIDATGILRTLQQLNDGAGTDAFVAAYNARHVRRERS